MRQATFAPAMLYPANTNSSAATPALFALFSKTSDLRTCGQQEGTRVGGVPHPLRPQAHSSRGETEGAAPREQSAGLGARQGSSVHSPQVAAQSRTSSGGSGQRGRRRGRAASRGSLRTSAGSPPRGSPPGLGDGEAEPQRVGSDVRPMPQVRHAIGRRLRQPPWPRTDLDTGKVPEIPQPATARTPGPQSRPRPGPHRDPQPRARRPASHGLRRCTRACAARGPRRSPRVTWTPAPRPPASAAASSRLTPAAPRLRLHRLLRRGPRQAPADARLARTRRGAASASGEYCVSRRRAGARGGGRRRRQLGGPVPALPHRGREVK